LSSTPVTISSPVPITSTAIQVLLRAFDAKFYSEEYHDLHQAPQELFAHFILKGVHEGRSLNPLFDVSEYLAANRDVLLSGLNPFYHYQVHGKQEGRSISPVIRIKQRLAILANRDDLDWIETIRPFIDENFYRNQLVSLQPYLTGYEIDLAVHYALLGWKLGLNPSQRFGTAQWIEEHSELCSFRLNPLLLDTIGMCSQLMGSDTSNNLLTAVPANPFATYEDQSDNLQPSIISGWAIADTQEEATSEERSEPPPAQSLGEDIEEILSLRLFDAHYYLATYVDVSDAGVDPLQHFMAQGWREGRDPSAGFSTAFYLTTYPEAAVSGLNPLVHYIRKGRFEGCVTKPPGGWKVEVLERCVSPSKREATFSSYVGKRITYESLKEAVLGKKTKPKANKSLPLLLALSHDSYSTVTGGTQIFIADEMKNANSYGIAHLHIAPATPGLTVASEKRPTEVIVTKDGVVLGAIEATEVFRLLRTTKHISIKLSIHSLIGFSAATLKEVIAVAKQAQTFLWLHDYSTLCDGFNFLRNDIAFCGAPPADSVECSICVYGSNRSERQSRIQEWFSSVNPIVVAPSEAALSIWKNTKSPLLVDQSFVVPHWSLSPDGARKRNIASPLRVAFIGFAVSSKGWPTYNEIVNTLAATADYKFFHFIKGGKSPNVAVQGVDCSVSLNDRMGSAALLQRHDIDVVMILSPWPETFSYVAAEALIAGCAIVCLENSGNVGALVNATKQGIVFKDEAALSESVASGTLLSALTRVVKRSCFHTVTQNRGIFDAIERAT
jgi:hypothetical protein